MDKANCFYIALMHMDDKDLLQQFREPASKEKAFTAIIKKYQEKLYWHIQPDGYRA